ncbi:(Fe-S)-binding protein, partial [Escherichia coli]|uniref:(Fe-S)-binding protein n=1 Tax=Escherichia coli TaxID=562 RepID=UPI001CA5F83A
LVYCKMSVGSTHHLEMVFVWKQNYILVDEYFFFCCTWIVNSAHKNSLGIYELSWHQAMQRLPRNRCLATGYSCRSQVKRVEGTGVRHPVQALLEIIK